MPVKEMIYLGEYALGITTVVGGLEMILWSLGSDWNGDGKVNNPIRGFLWDQLVRNSSGGNDVFILVELFLI